MFLNYVIIKITIKWTDKKQEEQELAIPTLLYSKPEATTFQLAYLCYT